MLAEIDKDTSLPREQREGLTKRLSGLDFFLGSSDSSLLPGELSIMSGPEIKAVDVVSDQVHPHSAYEITFPSSILWGLIGCCASFAISIVVERTRGTLLRLRLAPISRAQILAGKGLACFIASVTVSLLLLLFGALVFKVRLTNIPGLISAIVAASLCFVGLMMLISVLGRTEQAVSGSGWAILLVMGMTGGTMIPLWIMPKWMQTISHFSPVKWGILSLEGAIWRGFTLAEMLPPIAILLGVGLLSFAVGATIMSRSRM